MLVVIQSTRYSYHVVIKIEFSRQIFEKYSNMKFHENPSSGNRVLCGRADGQTDMMKLTVAFRNFANALQNDWRNYKRTKVWMRSNWPKLVSLACLFNHFHEAKCSLEAENFFSIWVIVYSSKTQITQLCSQDCWLNSTDKKNYSTDISPRENPRLSTSLFALPHPA
jgi:hypothetical protein